MIKVRITYTKMGWLKYTSNLDVQKLWERAIRRAHLPLAYSQGYHPKPRMNLAAPLPLGFSSSAELIDIWFTEEIQASEIQERLNGMFPSGIEIQKVKQIELSGASLQSLVAAGEYIIELRINLPAKDLEDKVAAILQSETIIRTRRNKEYDLRPLIQDLHIIDSHRLATRLTMLPKATGRPEEVLQAMQIDPNDARIERTALILAT
jgi:radical SAM-linked protein